MVTKPVMLAFKKFIKSEMISSNRVRPALAVLSFLKGRRFSSGALAALLLSPALALAETFNVSIIDNEFIPQNLAIAPGDTVKWTQNGGTDHTVTADDGILFNSGEIGPAAVFTYTFPSVGRFGYYCQLHGSAGLDMFGSIRVVDAANNHPPATPTNVTPAAGATNQSVSPTLTASAFSDEDAGDIHVASQWIVRDVTANTEVLDTGEDTDHKTSISLADLANGTIYSWKVRYKDDVGAWSAYSAETQFTTVSLPTMQGSGLTASYARYNVKKDLATIVFTGVDPTVEFDWGTAKPNKPTPANNFFVRWEGSVLPRYSEAYLFRVIADGGVRLWVNNVLVIDDWVKPAFAVYRNSPVELQAGVLASIKLEYFDTLGKASVKLRWSSESQPVQTIPQARLFPVEAQ